MATATLKLYASLSDFLPPSAVKNTVTIDLPNGATTVASALAGLRIPMEKCHLVLLNGHFVQPSQRADRAIRDGDTLACWPPVAGG